MNFNIITSSGGLQELPISGTPVIATEVRGYSPSNLISFIDMTNSVIENNPQYNLYERLVAISGSYPSEYILPQKFRGFVSGSLLVTDKSTVSRLVDFTLPLFHQYQLMFDYYVMDPSLPEGFILLRKNMESIVNSNNYLFESRTFPTASGRYVNSVSSGFIWSSQPVSGNVLTVRLLLPLREKDNFYTVEYNKYINNSITEYHNELITEQPIYNQGIDYTITPSSIILTGSSNIGSGVPIFIQKDPNTFIRIKQPSFIVDERKDKPWQFQISCGDFVHSSGIFGGELSYLIKNNHFNVGSGRLAPIEIPKIINKNILKLSTVPLYNSWSGYPSYNIADTIISGTLNGTDIRDKISSIDYNHGYVYLTQDIKPTDNLNMVYTYDDTKTMLAGSLDLNPRNTVNAPIDIAVDAIGLAVVPSGTTFYDSNTASVTDWSYLAYYKLSTNISGNFDSGMTSGYAVDVLTDDQWFGPISGVIPSGSKFMGFFSVNTLSKDMVKTYDVRRTGGYDSSTIRDHVSGWRGFSDIGYWDGEAFPTAGALLIQIPSGVMNNVVDIFKENGQYSQVTSMYTPDLTKIIERDTSRYDSIDQQIDKAAKKYIRDTIERYLPAGYLYIIVDENWNVWNSIRGDS